MFIRRCAWCPLHEEVITGVVQCYHVPFTLIIKQQYQKLHPWSQSSKWLARWSKGIYRREILAFVFYSPKYPPTGVCWSGQNLMHHYVPLRFYCQKEKQSCNCIKSYGFRRLGVIAKTDDRLNPRADGQRCGFQHYLCCQLISPSASYTWIGSALVQIMACRLFGAKSLSKPLLGHCQMDP